MVLGVNVVDTLDERLKAARSGSGLTQEQVAERLQVETTTVSFWEQGIRKPGRDNLVGLASLYGVSVDYLLGLADEEPRLPARVLLRELTNRYEMLSLTEIPMFGAVPAGEPVVPTESSGEHVEVPASLVDGVRRPFALRITGDSLSDMGIHDGQIVIVDPDAELVDGKVYIVQIEDEVTAKRVYMDGDDLFLEGAQGPIRIMELAHVKTLGRVVGAGSWRRF